MRLVNHLATSETNFGSDAAKRALFETERRGEVVAGLFRLAVFASIVLVLYLVGPQIQHGHPLVITIIVYGLMTVFGLVLAYFRFYHPLLPVVFVLADFATLSIAMGMLAQMSGMSMSSAMTLPLFSLAFVLLIHTAIRYRPWLVAMAACYFVAAMVVLPTLPWVTLAGPPMPMQQSMADMRSMMAAMSDISSALHFRVVPLLFVILAAALLFYIVSRTRNLVALAIREGERAAQLSRFFSPEVARRLVAHPLASSEYGRRQDVAVVFVDIRGFTHIAERMRTDELTGFLAEFRREVCKIIFRHGGTIDKFIGDGILAVFGTPTQRDDDARRTVAASFELKRAIHEWSQNREQGGQHGASIGIGAHCGEVFAGIIQSDNILEHTVIGDAVNIAQRLERATRSLDATVVVSEDLMVASGTDPQELGLIRRNALPIPGRDAGVTIYHDGL